MIMEGSLRREEVVGLVPAGGLAKRIAPLPCSKEIYPIGFRRAEGESHSRPKVVSHYLLEKMRLAGITKAYIVLREGKWDIPGYFRDGDVVDMHLAYLLLGLPFGTPYTLDQAYPFVQLLTRQTHSNACVILGLFPADQPERVDMVDRDDNGRVRQIVTKPDQTYLTHSWCIAVWTSVFTQFLHEYVAAQKETAGKKPEASVGEVVQAAIEAGLQVDAIPVSEKSYLDIGNAEGLVRAIQHYANS